MNCLLTSNVIGILLASIIGIMLTNNYIATILKLLNMAHIQYMVCNMDYMYSIGIFNKNYNINKEKV
mgnify:CR=1 FL=1|jgi:hypothetical protein